MKFRTLLALFFVYSSCGPSAVIEKEGFKFDSSLTKTQISLTTYDLLALQSYQFKGLDGEEFKKVFGVESEALRAFDWLDERVNVFIKGEDESEMEKRARIKETGFSRYASGIPPIEQLSECREPTKKTDESVAAEQGIKLAVNFGAQVYLVGKLNRQLLEVRIGIAWEVVRSPRDGIVAIYDSVFFDKKHKKSWKEKHMVYARLQTPLHEARHGDGHAESLGFLHAACPKGHDFECKNVCDSSVNGAYSVGYLFLKSAINSGEGLSVEGKELLKAMAADAYGRILPDGVHFDPAPEKVDL